MSEESFRVKGKDVRPDGTLVEEFNLYRGYWEAKDTNDNLDAEIRKKVAKGYPLINTIFEDTRSTRRCQSRPTSSTRRLRRSVDGRT